MSTQLVERGDIYDKYGLDSVDFDVEQFQSEWGARLADAGYTGIAGRILDEAQARQYLSRPLTSTQISFINDNETLVSAADAERFQGYVAQTDIVENFERLVDLRKTPETKKGKWTFTDATYHPACGEWAGREKLFLVRESVGRRLFQLATNLEHIDTAIHFEDGFRPLGVQEGLFARRIAMAKAEHPEWSDQELLLEARSKTAYTPRFAAHKAGAAVDVRLFSVSSGEFHDIGHEYPDGGEIVRLNTEFVTQTQWQNRKVLEHMAKSVGLLMYPYEDWHLCYGDATAAVVGSRSPYRAIYGPVKKYDSDTGAIQEVYAQEELDAVFEFGKDE